MIFFTYQFSLPSSFPFHAPYQVHGYAYEISLILSNLSPVLIIILVFGLPIKLTITYSRVWIGKFSIFRLGHKRPQGTI